MPQLAYEAAFAETDDARLQDLFTTYERTRSQLPLSQRIDTALTELGAPRQEFAVDGELYSGRQISLEIPWPSNGYQPRRVTVKQGIHIQYLDAIRGQSPGRLLESIDEASRESIGEEPLSFTENEYDASLRQGRLFICTIQFD
jgi:hypothetical protein